MTWDMEQGIWMHTQGKEFETTHTASESEQLPNASEPLSAQHQQSDDDYPRWIDIFGTHPT